MDNPVWFLVLTFIIFTLTFASLDISNNTTIKHDTFESIRASNQNALIEIQDEYNEYKEIPTAQMLTEWITTYCNNSNVKYKDIELNFVQMETDPPTFLVSIEGDVGHYAIVPKQALVSYYSGATIVSDESNE